MEDPRPDNPEKLPDRFSSPAPLPPITQVEVVTQAQRDFIDRVAINISSEHRWKPLLVECLPDARLESPRRGHGGSDRLELSKEMFTRVIAEYETWREINMYMDYLDDMDALRRLEEAGSADPPEPDGFPF
jgi:hypothetical protein